MVGRARVGTVPHSPIAAYGGDTVLAARKFAEWAPEDMSVTVLVDFENDSVRTALEVAEALGERLWGVRLDTSETLVDRSLWDEMGDFKATGVNDRLVQKTREALDAAGSGTCASSSPAASPWRRSARSRSAASCRRVRRRLLPHPRRQRLHRRCGDDRRAVVRQVRTPAAREPAAGARRVTQRGYSCTLRRGGK